MVVVFDVMHFIFNQFVSNLVITKTYKKMAKKVKSEKKLKTLPSFNSPKNWTENYKRACRCIDCKQTFFAQKKRMFCFECAGKLD
jgi:hypothetical protein